MADRRSHSQTLKAAAARDRLVALLAAVRDGEAEEEAEEEEVRVVRKREEAPEKEEEASEAPEEQSNPEESLGHDDAARRAKDILKRVGSDIATMPAQRRAVERVLREAAAVAPGAVAQQLLRHARTGVARRWALQTLAAVAPAHIRGISVADVPVEAAEEWPFAVVANYVVLPALRVEESGTGLLAALLLLLRALPVELRDAAAHTAEETLFFVVYDLLEQRELLDLQEVDALLRVASVLGQSRAPAGFPRPYPALSCVYAVSHTCLCLPLSVSRLFMSLSPSQVVRWPVSHSPPSSCRPSRPCRPGRPFRACMSAWARLCRRRPTWWRLCHALPGSTTWWRHACVFARRPVPVAPLTPRRRSSLPTPRNPSAPARSSASRSRRFSALRLPSTFSSTRPPLSSATLL